MAVRRESTGNLETSNAEMQRVVQEAHELGLHLGMQWALMKVCKTRFGTVPMAVLKVMADSDDDSGLLQLIGRVAAAESAEELNRELEQ